MAEKTLIAWADHTFNCWWGCTKVSPGCANCYADLLARRYGSDCWAKSPRRIFGDKHWNDPLVWHRAAQRDGERRRVFCGSMCDWAEDRPELNDQRERLWSVIRETPGLDWLLLTKRPERIPECLPDAWPRGGWPNVWLGTSIESDKYAWRADELRKLSAVVRFVSYEPALGPVPNLKLSGIDWLIYGGESGPGYRHHDVQWARDIRDRCEANGTEFFFKQSSAPRTEMGIELDGQIVRNYPAPRKGRLPANSISDIFSACERR